MQNKETKTARKLIEQRHFMYAFQNRKATRIPTPKQS